MIQVDKCERAKSQVKAEVNKFGDDYFYDLKLNQRFCVGIVRFLEARY
jgi:hypothetical protein